MHTLCTEGLNMTFCFKMAYHVWRQPVRKLCSWIPCVLWDLSMLFLFQKYIWHWYLTWIQPVCKLCSCIPCVLWVLSILFKYIPHWCLTWIQPACKLCSCRCLCIDLQFNTISYGCQIGFKQDVSGCCSLWLIIRETCIQLHTTHQPTLRPI